MSENYTDPSGNTEQFRAFAHTPEAAATPAPSRLPLIVAAAVVAVVLLALAAWLALS
ncbi:hypothetical protein [Micromonospora mirobrigensis]|uniref:Uncharacterized protein n=1 Tax=Micromonospora mirobrigensis TaxID=262898 RepID=A0A1C4XSI7_9ACTN|nr:hypothetical protein [Micromonospora mirobrigensis]SCF11479.1 hypothetical protein GA0070564_103309 [Micromonospora mirobrigensis]